jgi:Tol biopolymer transport system component
MTSIERFERDLPALFENLAEPQTPDYIDDLFWQTAHTTQRSAWAFPERWLPMLEIARRPVVAARLPWRPLAVVALVVFALVASLMLAGAQRRLPPLYGPAANGMIATSSNGDIFTYDPRTGVSRAIITGPANDIGPVWSPDGTRLVFERMTEAHSTLFIARDDGTRLRELTPDGLDDVRSYEVSPDGASVAIVAGIDGIPSLYVARADGGGLHRLQTGSQVWGATFRPTGSDILFVGPHGADGSYSGIYLIDPDGTNLRTLVEPQVDANIEGDARWSPNGTQIAYARWEPSVVQHDLRVHVMAADGTGDRIVGHADGAWWESGPLVGIDQSPFAGGPLWSPDGQKLLIERKTGGGNVGNLDYASHPSTPVVVTVDGSAADVGIRFELSSHGSVAGWSPDGSAIQATPLDESGDPAQQLLWEPLTGHSRTAPWTATSYPAWQRVAP